MFYALYGLCCALRLLGLLFTQRAHTVFGSGMVGWWVYERMHVSVSEGMDASVCVYTMSPSTRLLIIQAVG